MPGAESLSTLKFANRAKNIKNSAQVSGLSGNEDRLASKNEPFTRATSTPVHAWRGAKHENAPRCSVHSIAIGPQVNEDVDQRTLLRKYERELRRLRAELQQRQRELVDKRHLLAVRRRCRRVSGASRQPMQTKCQCRDRRRAAA